MADHSLKKEQDADAKFKPVHEVLQANLLDQLLLTLQVKQAHWNIVGPRFISIHEYLDSVYETMQEQTDQSAERIRQLRAFPNGSADLVAENETFVPMPNGPISDSDVVDLITHRLELAIDAFRDRLATIEDIDTVTADIIHGQIEDLEIHAWKMRSMK